MYKLPIAILLGLGLSAFGADARIQHDGGSFSPEQGLHVGAGFQAQRSAILKALDDGKTYAEISVDNRRNVRESLERISGLLGDRQRVEELPEHARIELINEQEKVNVLLGQAREDSRLVCTREKQIGSLRSVSKCATVAERRRAREASQQEMFEMGRHGTKIESN
ncbi:hypothetical protein CSC62_04005 [Pseudoxanthomonas jiangsuensis]|uniref:hypothetical protein n=1 Tax=Pseudoxanthomonas jiangsuensis TaxID=619688 RepID=UPI0013918DB1|nr:hypothetical protein [Pseudoxanthomonas jiangsuensis]KAF1698721.1 hypothetical protein CSC62_04005 [Pseudoxanthomonas jiangsuensis]